MADLKAFAEQLVNLTVKEVNELAGILKDEYGIEPAAAAVAVAAPAGGGAEGGDAAEGEALKMIITKLEFSGGQLRATSELKPGEELDLKLGAIKMSNIGKAEGGVTADVVAQEITSELAGVILTAVAKAGITKTIEKKTKGFLDKLKGDG